MRPFLKSFHFPFESFLFSESLSRLIVILPATRPVRPGLLRKRDAGQSAALDAGRDILRAEFAHWLKFRLIHEEAKRHTGSGLLLWNSDYPGKPISAESQTSLCVKLSEAAYRQKTSAIGFHNRLQKDPRNERRLGEVSGK